MRCDEALLAATGAMGFCVSLNAGPPPASPTAVRGSAAFDDAGAVLAAPFIEDPMCGFCDLSDQKKKSKIILQASTSTSKLNATSNLAASLHSVVHACPVCTGFPLLSHPKKKGGVAR